MPVRLSRHCFRLFIISLPATCYLLPAQAYTRNFTYVVLLTAPLALAGNAITVTIHLSIGAMLDIECRFCAGTHVAAMGFTRFTLESWRCLCSHFSFVHGYWLNVFICEDWYFIDCRSFIKFLVLFKAKDNYGNDY